MGILHALENALGRHAELSEYAPKVEAVVEDLAARVERLESFFPASTPEPADPTPTPTSEATSGAADAGSSSAGTAPDVAAGSTTATTTTPAEQNEPGQV